MVENFTIKNLLTESECDEIIGYSTKNLNLTKALVGTEAIYNEKMRKSSVSITNYDSVFPFIKQRLLKQLPGYMNVKGHEINFDNQPYQFTKYEKGEYYNWHVDSIDDGYMAKRYCSIVIQLNNSYTGGELQMQKNEDDDIITFECGKGNLFVFLSNIRHRVNTVTGGTRYSLVSWFTLKPIENFKKTLI
jgi:predicted 2-oxoglutarate/Fe(II)-dependent dioxygenase YbiX